MARKFSNLSTLEVLIAALTIGLVIIGVYWGVRQWLMIQSQRLSQQQLRLHLEKRLRQYERLLPYKAQAYERLILFLERISPHYLLNSSIVADEPATAIRTRWIRQIREEWLYNASQQLYVSSEAWQVIDNAVEQTIMLINRTLQEIHPDLGHHAFIGKFRENVANMQTLPHQVAIDMLKAEFHQFVNS